MANKRDKKQLIFDTARTLFLENGFKQTNVAMITSKASIGVGTFYKYYSSKEEIFYEVYRKENEETKKYIVEHINTDQSPKELLKQFLSTIIKIGKNNAILAEWYQNSEVSKMIMEQNNEYDFWQHSYVYEFLIDNIKAWRKEGIFRKDISLDTTLALFNSIVVVDNHKEEVGIEHYPKVLELLADMIIEGLEQS